MKRMLSWKQLEAEFSKLLKSKFWLESGSHPITLLRSLGKYILGRKMCNLTNFITIICFLIWRNLQPHSYQRRRTYYYPGIPVHTKTFPTPQRSIRPGYRLQRHGWSMDNSFLCVWPGFHFTAEWTGAHFRYNCGSVTLGTSILGTSGLEPTISWLRVQCLNHSANCPLPTLLF